MIPRIHFWQLCSPKKFPKSPFGDLKKVTLQIPGIKIRYNSAWPVLFCLFIRPLFETEELIAYADDNYMGEEHVNLELAVTKKESARSENNNKILSNLIKSTLRVPVARSVWKVVHSSSYFLGYIPLPRKLSKCVICTLL